MPIQRYVIAPFISILLLYGGFIQGVSIKRVMDDFLKKCTKISLKLGISTFEGSGQSKAARAKTIEYRYKHFTSSRPRI